jgi:hypothetical protein
LRVGRLVAPSRRLLDTDSSFLYHKSIGFSNPLFVALSGPYLLNPDRSTGGIGRAAASIRQAQQSALSG